MRATHFLATHNAPRPQSCSIGSWAPCPPTCLQSKSHWTAGAAARHLSRHLGVMHRMQMQPQMTRILHCHLLLNLARAAAGGCIPIKPSPQSHANCSATRLLISRRHFKIPHNKIYLEVNFISHATLAVSPSRLEKKN